MSSRGRILLAGAAALVLAAIVAVGAYALTRSDSGSGTQAPLTVPPAVQRFPKPPAGAFVVAREDATDALALAVVNRSSGLGLQVSDVDQNGDGATGLHVSVGVASKGGTVTKTAIACGRRLLPRRRRRSRPAPDRRCTCKVVRAARARPTGR